MADTPSLTDLQHWTWVMGRAQQMMMEQGLGVLKTKPDAVPVIPGVTDPATIERATEFWTESMALWQRFLDPARPEPAPVADKRFKAPQWREPVFDLIRQSYELIGDHMLRGVDALEGVPAKQKEQLRFATRGFVDAMSPTNFPITNPQVIDKTIETNGANLLKGLQHMLADLSRGQMTHTPEGAFEVGRDLATTPGQVIKRTPLYELIHYAPTTETVLATPLVIFPPWINRFYILDLTPEKSFIRWAVGQGLSVFMVSWKSADATMKDVVWDDYVAAQVDAIETVRALLDVPAVHSVGYCVAGTTLAATLALLAARGQAETVASATFFTAQVDFTAAGELQHFIDDEQLAMLAQLSPDGFLDGRYMATTFNLLRGRDLIWNYVTQNYLLGQDHVPFDLLHWNGDTTNLPAKWHMRYLTDLYRDNLLVTPGAITIDGTPIDLTKVITPTYVQAGREDHIAPAESVWKLTQLFAGAVKFVLAGSGHIAGVVNPPAAGKYQFWTNPSVHTTLEDFIAGATETKGSWWPDWIDWIRTVNSDVVAADGARQPGEGSLPALEPAPGTYVRAR
ncbi:class I poly(R)-hydroxyalkanoic acid synthase [Sphingomonas ginsenosidivorax]|uniref:Class I poly(R)-hydroxyalkanoic acid synthase n=1 Tax=Sphingomonas ginsenosidivorax TaxID=862135 RepID=A0A5C6UGK4_9SPHN|nr:class I poly(R)-hydroxyalkanoic acid synthase [Sphingomonas ginsenosidivorax]TXC71829.1 class I poly(R)-hydroxyalkanoic acid synthase [Sphingomonas ginsenosidivorax]